MTFYSDREDGFKTLAEFTVCRMSAQADTQCNTAVMTDPASDDCNKRL